jgi:hypothetical protein
MQCSGARQVPDFDGAGLSLAQAIRDHENPGTFGKEEPKAGLNDLNQGVPVCQLVADNGTGKQN